MDNESDSILISALQKMIRRCDLKGTLYMTQQLFIPYDCNRWLRLKRRLYIIATEDIGISEIGIIDYLNQELNGINSEMDLNKLLKVVATLTLCHKSRLTDHMCIYFKTTKDAWINKYIEVKSVWNLDYEETNLIKYAISLTNKKDSERLWLYLIENCEDGIYKNEITDIHKTWQQNDCILYIIHAILILIRQPKYEHNFKIYEGDLTVEKVEIPDYVYDKHTKIGRQMDRGIGHFIRSSCVVHNTRTELVDQYWTYLLDLYRDMN